MEAEIKKEFLANIELIAGSGGVFEVAANGTELFSKKRSNRFPEPGEIAELIKAFLPS